MPDDKEILRPIADETGLALSSLQDLTQELHTKEEKLEEQNGVLGGELRPAVRSQSLTALLVDKARGDQGTVATPTPEFVPAGNRELYLVPALAFGVPR